MKVKVDSRKVNPGDLFIALERGHQHIEQAIKNGATRVVAEYGNYSVPTVIVEDSRKYLSSYLIKHYQDKLKNIKLIGITGTNGKTTTAYLIYQALNKLGIKCSYIGTIGFYLNDQKTELVNTTPDLLDVYEMLIQSSESGCKFVVMEASSQGLDLRRLEGIEFDYAVFTNLTKDHLDYHKTMENYALAKKILFNQLKPKGKAIVNIDDDYHEYFLVPNKTITYGFSDGDYQITDYNIKNLPVTGNVLNGDEEIKFEINLLGKHNLYNSLVTMIILNLLKIDKNLMLKTLKQLESPIGRMDTIVYNDNKIIIDYAHTPDAVLNCLLAVREINHNQIYTIIGCGGNRDRSKRPEMAKVSTDYSTKAIFTSDNPRFEKIEKIIDDMTNELVNSNFEIEYDREKAIKKGVQMLSKNDILLILGKGHETYQIIENEVMHFDDKEKVLQLIRR